MTQAELADLVPANIRTLAPYLPGKPVAEVERELGISGAIKLASNENPMGPSPRAIAAAAAALPAAHDYPDAGTFSLRRALAAKLKIQPEELCIGAGSNELISLIVTAFCRPGKDEVLTHRAAFLSYRLAAAASGVDFVEAEITEDLACDPDAFIAAITPRTKIVFLANPNNPTGAHVGTAAFERILAAMPDHAILVVDEAYHEYAAGTGTYPSSADYRSASRPLILTLRTFSKAHGLAGLRVGYAIGDPAVIDILNRVRRPFNASIVAQAAAEAALSDDDHLARSISVTREVLAEVAALSRKLSLTPYPTLANFVCIGIGRPAAEVYEPLLREGVIVRPLGGWGLPDCIRVSACRPEHLGKVAAAFHKVFG